jgi:hypothetical protein
MADHPRPQFKSVDRQVAELAAYAAAHTPEETRDRLAGLSPGVRRKVQERLRRRAAEFRKFGEEVLRPARESMGG